MIAKLFMNGRYIGEVKYEHPKDEEGNVHVLPRPDDKYTEVQVMVQDENDKEQLWMSPRLPLWKT